MKVQLGHIVQHLFHTGSIDEVPVSRLQELAETYPYFSAGHLLLSQKLLRTKSAEFDEQVQRTALYFHDPLWLHWQLNQVEEKVAVAEVAEPEVAIAEVSAPKVEVESKLDVPQTGIEPQQIVQQEIEIPAQPEIVESDHGLQIVDNGFHEVIAEPEVETATEPIIPAVPEPQPPNPEPETPAFEPYHTIDYFASQGIKVSADVQPNDRLGKQLRSFTEWLKTMKRLPQTAPNEQSEENGDQDIRRIAAGSLVEKEVVTETMAEVLVKQDKRHEAIAIYEKLSLLDPSKSAYFAAKIENLKEN